MVFLTALKTQRAYLAPIFCIWSCLCFSQGINGYANVSAISGRTLTVNSVSETNDTFEDGEYVIIMQMQDNVIGTNTTNASTFGDLGSSGILSAGLYETAVISSHTESGGLPNSIVLTNNLVNTYNINSNASVQLITFRFLGTNFASTGNVTTTAWNGTIGGVTAMSVGATFSLNHNISANQAGFTGGLKNTPNGYNSCNSTNYAAARSRTYACKGEGIYKNTNSAFACARGKILNGGGGGNDVNAGGGGGGNYTAGGGGGVGWTGAAGGCSPGAGGLGGIALGGSITVSRIFMGGGGGGGHENNNNGNIGGAGGGIIIIKAGTVVTTSCSGITISANGGTVSTVTNDGAGGGGAGGTIVFSVNTFSIVGSCPLTINADGGGGGSANQSGADAHGGGGGGGQGAVLFSTAQPTTNMTTNTRPGVGGSSCSGCAASTNGSVGTGTNNSGIIPSAGNGPLPVELLSFSASVGLHDDVELLWSTALEKNHEKFVVQRMDENKEVLEIGEVFAKGSYSIYRFYDNEPLNGVNYYRLKQVDRDGTENLTRWQEIQVQKKFEHNDVAISPNPNGSGQPLDIEIVGTVQDKIEVQLFDATGRLLGEYSLSSGDRSNKFKINIPVVEYGVYVVRVVTKSNVFMKKLVISN